VVEGMAEEENGMALARRKQCRPVGGPGIGGGGGGGNGGGGEWDGGGPKCGPDITQALADTMAWVDTELFIMHLMPWRLARNCIALLVPSVWSWDIDPLVGYGDRPEHHGPISNPYFDDYIGCAPRPCWATVQVYGKCYYSFNVNYVLFGRVARACAVPLLAAREAAKEFKFWTGRGWEADDAAAWTEAGYNGWPRASTPPEQVSGCARCIFAFPVEHFCWKFGGDYYYEGCFPFDGCRREK